MNHHICLAGEGMRIINTCWYHRNVPVEIILFCRLKGEPEHTLSQPEQFSFNMTNTLWKKNNDSFVQQYLFCFLEAVVVFCKCISACFMIGNWYHIQGIQDPAENLARKHVGTGKKVNRAIDKYTQKCRIHKG